MFSGTPPAGGPLGGGIGFNTPIHELIGISEEELAAALQVEGATIASVADDHGLTRDELRAALLDDARTRLDAEVDAGTIGSEEAATQIEMFEGVVDGILDSSGMPGGFGDPPR